jgi:hypothetical protein
MRDTEGDERDAVPAARSATRIYANDLAVAFSLSEVELRFGQRFSAEQPAEVLCWIVTSPVHLAAFGRMIEVALARYEAQFGAIPGAGAPGGRADH